MAFTANRRETKMLFLAGERLPSPGAFAMTYEAAPPPVFSEEDCFWRIDMAIGADQMIASSRLVAPLNVYCPSNQFKMINIDAVMPSTEVIDLQTIRDVFVDGAVDEAVRRNMSTVDPKPCVAGWITSAGPEPALPHFGAVAHAWPIAVDEAPEALSRCRRIVISGSGMQETIIMRGTKARPFRKARLIAVVNSANHIRSHFFNFTTIDGRGRKPGVNTHDHALKWRRIRRCFSRWMKEQIDG